MQIMIKGRNVMMGYLADEVKTAQAIDENGWLHTGDIGELDKVRSLHIYIIIHTWLIFQHKNIIILQDGYLIITGRKSGKSFPYKNNIMQVIYN